MRNVRKWLRDVETRLIPVNLATNWTLESLEERYKEQEVSPISASALSV